MLKFVSVPLGELRWRDFDYLYAVAHYLCREAALVYTSVFTSPDIPYLHSVRRHSRTEGAPSHCCIRSASTCSVQQSRWYEVHERSRTLEATLSWKRAGWLNTAYQGSGELSRTIHR